MYSSTVDVDRLVKQLTLGEKISLLAGRDMWNTTPVPRLQIPSLKVTDGPNGARGEEFFNGSRAACFPAPVSMAATWDRQLIKKIGNALAEETIAKGASCLLAPTVCPHRSPLGGRNFESFSEDPRLAGEIAAAYVIGVQERGVAATIKHFVANEQETLRFKINVIVSERALREIYLKPFEIAIKTAKPWAVMTSYNRVNGTFSDENTWLIQTILRDQWGFKGLTMSDWGGTHSMKSISAGLDLEMPGPAKIRTLQAAKMAIDTSEISIEDVDERVRAVLTLLAKTGKFDAPEEQPEQSTENPLHWNLIREAGADGIVLLKNRENCLPLDAAKLQTIGVFGLAKQSLAHGGGSAALTCSHKISPFEALDEFLKPSSVTLRYAQGTHFFRKLPAWSQDMYDKNGQAGMTLLGYTSPKMLSEPLNRRNLPTPTFLDLERAFEAVVLEGVYHPTVSGSHYFTLTSFGNGRLFIDDELVYANDTGNSDAFMTGSDAKDMKQFAFTAGNEYKIRVESQCPAALSGPMEILGRMVGVHVGFMAQSEFEADLVTEAREVAASVDVALIFTGHTTEWETEGIDRTTLNLPIAGSQDSLIEAVSSVNPNTIVINSTGSAVEMPWLDSVAAVLQAFFPGQEAGRSIVDVLFGTVNPSGKLPFTFPRTMRDTPTYDNFPGDIVSQEVHYAEGIEIGYRYYDKHPQKALFPFGFGLSYTQFMINEVTVHDDDLGNTGKVHVVVQIKNVGSRPGKEVVQLYVAFPSTVSGAPIKTLAQFAKVSLEIGEILAVSLATEAEQFATWDESTGLWLVEAGEYGLMIGNSSASATRMGAFVVKNSFCCEP